MNGSAGRMRWRDEYLHWLLIIPMFIVIAPAAMAQRPGLPGGGLAGPPQVIDPREDDSKMAQQMKKARNVMRQKKLESQMKLLDQLTAELSAEAGGTPTDALLSDCARKSEQIEKLAKSIRELMIGPFE